MERAVLCPKRTARSYAPAARLAAASSAIFFRFELANTDHLKARATD
jgi:hypothetical protein